MLGTKPQKVFLDFGRLKRLSEKEHRETAKNSEKLLVLQKIFASAKVRAGAVEPRTTHAI